MIFSSLIMVTIAIRFNEARKIKYSIFVKTKQFEKLNTISFLRSKIDFQG